MTSGTSLKLTDMSISFNSDGEIVGSNMTPLVRFDVTFAWLAIAEKHLDQASNESTKQVDIWIGDDNEAKSACLEGEFSASMQAIMAAAIAIDAFYAVVKDLIDIPEETENSWTRNRTARYIRVTEVLRLAFRFDRTNTKILKDNLNQIYRFRDMVVHPKGDYSSAVHRPDLNVSLVWQFTAFSFSNADPIVKEARHIVTECMHSTKAKTDALAKHCESLRSMFPRELDTLDTRRSQITPDA